MKYLKTFENYYQDMLQYYKSNFPFNEEEEEDNDTEKPEDLIDENDVEVDDIIKPANKDINDSINKFNNLM